MSPRLFGFELALRYRFVKGLSFDPAKFTVIHSNHPSLQLCIIPRGSLARYDRSAQVVIKEIWIRSWIKLVIPPLPAGLHHCQG
jgi:hypothetical protein